MSAGTILREDRGPVSVLTINRPRILNAVDIATIRELGDQLREVMGDEAVRVAVLTGAGEKAFSAGGDIAEMATFTGLKADQLMDSWQDTLALVESAHKPVIAAVNGIALGGGTEIAMTCHIRTASETAVFGQTEIALDHLPGAGGTQRMPRLLPLGVAYEYLLTGNTISADEAHRLGFVNHVWPQQELMARTMELAERIALRAPGAVRMTLEAVRLGLQGSLEAGLRLERALAGLILDSAEARQGLEHFLAKRRRNAR